MNRVGVIGWNITHSLSPVMHNAAFAALGMHDWHYDLLPVPPDIVGYSLRTLRNEGGYIGVNVTIPLKQEALKHCLPDETAQRIGAVNTIDLRSNRGYNTDAVGFIEDLRANGIDPTGQRVLVLGAGGAARAAVYALSYSGAQVSVVNRSPDKAQQMLDDLLVRAELLSVEQAALSNAALVVNCTPAGMHPHPDATPWREDLPLPSGGVVYDMIYRPAKTRLLLQAEAQGLRAVGGLGMLVRQGAAAFALWTGREAPLEAMFAAVRAALEQP